MNEIIGKRTLTSKHFDAGNNNIEGRFHAGHIHFVDKFNTGAIEDINWNLLWDDQRLGWYFDTHSFHPFIPQYADNWVEFRDVFDQKDQTIRYKAHASHVRGRLVIPVSGDTISNSNYVIYDDAFGKGFDYILYFTRHTLKKVVRIRDGFKPTTDAQFTWDIDFPKVNGSLLPIARGINKADVETQLVPANLAISEKLVSPPAYGFDPTISKTFNSAKSIFIGDEKGDGHEWFTCILPFQMWDSGGIDEKCQTANVNYDAVNKTITKIIPATFFASSLGDVFADTTTSYLPNTTWNDGIYYANTVFATAHNATSGSGLRGATAYISCKLFSSNYSFERAPFTIDTSGLTAKAVISAATLFINMENQSGTLDNQAGLYNGNGNADVVVVGDYSKIGTTKWSDTLIAFSSLTTSFVAKQYPWNATGLANISLTGKTKFGMREDKWDVGNSAPSTSANIAITFQSAETAGTANDPYLSVTYTAGTSSPSRRRFLIR